MTLADEIREQFGYCLHWLGDRDYKLPPEWREDCRLELTLQFGEQWLDATMGRLGIGPEIAAGLIIADYKHQLLDPVPTHRVPAESSREARIEAYRRELKAIVGLPEQQDEEDSRRMAIQVWRQRNKLGMVR